MESDHSMNLTDVFYVTFEPPEPLRLGTNEVKKNMVSDHSIYLSDAFYSKKKKKKCVVDTFTTPSKLIIPTIFRPHIKESGHHHRHVHYDTMNISN
ncbi:hypothetical protein M9Y10_026034 [Tritrichomonas musculus]|uniref:Uncharacterized protein n=1 Tax=Tritrichomonas musculus TaxID=1915356 RepID=A0ABR2HA50_9EUKA